MLVLVLCTAGNCLVSCIYVKLIVVYEYAMKYILWNNTAVYCVHLSDLSMFAVAVSACRCCCQCMVVTQALDVCLMCIFMSYVHVAWLTCCCVFEYVAHCKADTDVNADTCDTVVLSLSCQM